jgi:hypothetical protein
MSELGGIEEADEESGTEEGDEGGNEDELVPAVDLGDEGFEAGPCEGLDDEEGAEGSEGEPAEAAHPDIAEGEGDAGDEEEQDPVPADLGDGIAEEIAGGGLELVTDFSEVGLLRRRTEMPFEGGIGEGDGPGRDGAEGGAEEVSAEVMVSGDPGAGEESEAEEAGGDDEGAARMSDEHPDEGGKEEDAEGVPGEESDAEEGPGGDGETEGTSNGGCAAQGEGFAGLIEADEDIGEEEQQDHEERRGETLRGQFPEQFGAGVDGGSQSADEGVEPAGTETEDEESAHAEPREVEEGDDGFGVGTLRDGIGGETGAERFREEFEDAADHQGMNGRAVEIRERGGEDLGVGQAEGVLAFAEDLEGERADEMGREAAAEGEVASDLSHLHGLGILEIAGGTREVQGGDAEADDEAEDPGDPAASGADVEEVDEALDLEGDRGHFIPSRPNW